MAPRGQLAFDVVKTGEFTYELRDKTTGQKANILDYMTGGQKK